MGKLDLGQLLTQKIKAKIAETQVSEKKLLAWGKYYFPHYFPGEFHKAHYEIEVIAESYITLRGQRHVIRIPRGYAKSSTVSFLLAIKGAVEGKEKYTLLGSETSELADKSLSYIKAEIEGNEKLREDYPQACKDPVVWNSSRIELGNKTCIETFGKGTGVRGSRYGEHRPTLIILDDPQKDADVNSPTTRENDIQWIVRTLLPIGSAKTNILFVGNDIHQDSIVGTFARNAAFKDITYAAIEKWPLAMDLWDEWETIWHEGEAAPAEKFFLDNLEAMTEGVELLWAQKDTIYTLMVERATMGHAAFDAEYQNNPRDPSKAEFDAAKLDLAFIGYDSLVKELEGLDSVKIGYMDPSSGLATKRHDHPAIIEGYYVPKKNKLFLVVNMDKEPVHKRIEWIKRSHLARPYLAFGVESNGFQSLVAGQLLAECPLLNVVPIENMGVHKNTRISRLNLWFDRDFIRMARRCKQTQILLTQLLQHPHASHDDGPDALEGLIRVLTMFVNLYNPMEPPSITDGLGNNLCNAFY